MQLKNIKIINHNKIIENADIEINNGIISSITPKDGEAEYIILPGFIDTHIHGFNGDDSMDGKEAIERISASLGKKGTSTFFPTLMTDNYDVILNKISEATQAESKGSLIGGFHLEGPFISHAKKGAHDENYIKPATDEYIKKLIDTSKGMLKKITIAPESITINQTKTLVAAGVMPSLGHSNTDADTANDYIRSGAHSATHL